MSNIAQAIRQLVQDAQLFEGELENLRRLCGREDVVAFEAEFITWQQQSIFAPLQAVNVARDIYALRGKLPWQL